MCVLCSGLKESVRTGALVSFSPQRMQPTYTHEWLPGSGSEKNASCSLTLVIPKLRRQQEVQKYLHDGHAQNGTVVNCSQLSRWILFPAEMLCEVHQLTWASQTGTLKEVKKTYCGIWIKETTESNKRKKTLESNFLHNLKVCFHSKPR